MTDSQHFDGRNSPVSYTLSGLKIVDLTRVLGGPYGTQVLGDHGADVIKVEPPQGDEVRDWGPPFHEEDAAYFIGVNRNKRAMALDLTQSRGREVLMDLLSDADVLIENYKPGTMEKWGIGYEQVLARRFPQLIHCRISGFGSDGPLGGSPGYDAIVQAMAGWFSVNGEAGGSPTRLGVAMVDMGTGLYAALAVMMALYEREKSGQGQYIDMTLFDCAVSLMHPHVVNYGLSGKIPAPTGNAHPNICPYDTFRTRTIDIFIGAGNNRAFARLCAEIDAEELLNDPRFVSNAERVKHREALKVELESKLVRLDGASLAEKLLAAGLPAGPIYNTAEVAAHPHTKHRDMFVEKDWYKMTGIPIKFSRTPGQVRTLPPKFSQHSLELLQEQGFSESEIKALVEGGIVPLARR